MHVSGGHHITNRCLFIPCVSSEGYSTWLCVSQSISLSVCSHVFCQRTKQEAVPINGFKTHPKKSHASLRLFNLHKSTKFSNTGGSHSTRAIDHAPRAMGGTINKRTQTTMVQFSKRLCRSAVLICCKCEPLSSHESCCTPCSLPCPTLQKQ